MVKGVRRDVGDKVWRGGGVDLGHLWCLGSDRKLWDGGCRRENGDDG